MPTASKPQDTFQPGDILAERFQVRHLIARGGMGEVYEVEDLTLHERLALKTIHPEWARDFWALERFMQEVHLARQVTHPNVCRMFDVFRHEFDNGLETTFVTMELLEGETLTHFLDARGRMMPDEALPLVRQMAAGLDAAHRAGVIHRDFKSDNVTLVPSEDAEGGLRVVITDFGLASAMAASGEADRLLEEEGLIMGTLAYMAPEQLLDGEITAATDLYALGVVIFEMVTGKLPFPDSRTTSEINDGSATGIRSLGSEPPSPREHVPDLDAHWEHTIMRVLRRRPAERFSSARELEAALLGVPVESLTSTELPMLQQRMGRQIRLTMLLIGALILLLIVFFAWQRQSAETPTSPEGDSPTGMVAGQVDRPSVAILGLNNLSGREADAWLGIVLSEMITTELAAGGELRMISGETVSRALLQLGLDREALEDRGSTLLDGISMDHLARLRALLDADQAILGTYFLSAAEGGELRLDLRILDTSSGDLVGVRETGPRDDLLDLVAILGQRLRDEFEVSGTEDATKAAANVRAALPSDPEAARLYAEGLERLRHFDALEASRLLGSSVELDADAPLTHAALARAWGALGFEERAAQAAHRAEELSSGLSREQALFLHANALEAAREWPEAIAKYRSLWDFYPDDLDYGLRLATAQRKSGDGAAALATLEALRGLDPPASLDPRIGLSEAEVYDDLSEYPESRNAARAAAERGRELGARWVTAQALLQEGRSTWRLGELEEARKVIEQARDIFAEVGDRSGMAEAINLLGNVSSDQNELTQTRALYTEASAIFRQIGNTSGAARTLNNLGNVASNVGAFQEALGRYEEALTMSRELNDARSIARGLNNVALALEALGDLDGARERYEEALRIVEEIDMKIGVGLVNENLAGLFLQQGMIEEARRHFEIAESVQRETGATRHLATILHRRGELLTVTGEFDAATESFREARALRLELGALEEVALTDTATAALAVAQERPADAEALARAALEELGGGERRDGEAEARAVLADALRLRGELGQARQEIDRALELIAESQSASVKITVRIAASRMAIAEGEIPTAEELLRKALSTAEAARLQEKVFDARLAFLQAALAKPATASEIAPDLQGRLEELGKEARLAGYGLVAQQAQALAAGTP